MVASGDSGKLGPVVILPPTGPSPDRRGTWPRGAVLWAGGGRVAQVELAGGSLARPSAALPARARMDGTGVPSDTGKAAMRVLVSPWIVALVPLMGVLLGYSLWILVSDPHIWLGIGLTALSGFGLVHAGGQQIAVLTAAWVWVPFHRRIRWVDVDRAVIESVPTTIGNAYSVVLYTNRRSRWSGERMSCTLPGLASSREDSPRLLRYMDLIESRISAAQQR